jgi:hypothetical protein
VSKIKFLKEHALNQLQANITSNQNRYLENEPWLNSYLPGANWFLESNVLEIAPIQLQLPTTKTRLFDLENTRTVYAALQHLTPLQAADPRLWAYLTHVTYWEYMRKRWPMEQYTGKPRMKEIIQERYFLMSDRSRALIRNGLARLWWYGYCSYDETREDPFELTSALLKNLDVTQSILERAFSRNISVTKALLGVLLEQERAGKAFYVRERVRDLAKYLVQIGGVTIIDALQEPELRKVVTGKIEQLSATA